MFRRSARRLTTTVLVALSLLFSQLALARYVCPAQADAQAMAAMVAAGLPCDGLDPQQPALCHQHAADPGKTFEAAKLPALAQAVIVQVMVLPLALQAREAAAVPVAASPAAQAPPDPLFLSTLRLRV